jgi:hypothetical protein
MADRYTVFAGNDCAINEAPVDSPLAEDHARAREKASFVFNAMYTMNATPASRARRVTKYVATAV